MTSITMAGWEFFPSRIDDTPMLIGGGGRIRRALDATGRKRGGIEKLMLELSWDRIGPDEFQRLRIVWEWFKESSVVVKCADPLVESKSFLLRNDELRFARLEGSAYRSGSLILEEV